MRWNKAMNDERLRASRGRGALAANKTHGIRLDPVQYAWKSLHRRELPENLELDKRTCTATHEKVNRVFNANPEKGMK